MLRSSSESHRYELYYSSGAGSDDALEFTSLINHSLVVQQAEHVTAGVDSALEQLRTSMAAISELKQANKYASPVSPWLSSFWHRDGAELPGHTALHTACSSVTPDEAWTNNCCLAGLSSAMLRPYAPRATAAFPRRDSSPAISVPPPWARPCSASLPRP